ncbi:MAG: PGF-CTERM sorting domain-containing protein [Methanotrichaceae archaeon]|nr:PGF-CTERM sorting domain-containing protein [Methanotrichaceae archaeon]
MQQAKEQINKNLPITQEQLQEKAKEDLKKQANEKIQSPGFELILAVSGLITAVYMLRRRR